MTIDDSQSFLRELDRKLWTAADKLRSSLDAAVYKHAVLGLISNPTTWRLAAMNMAIRGIDATPDDTFLRDAHPDLKANYL